MSPQAARTRCGGHGTRSTAPLSVALPEVSARGHCPRWLWSVVDCFSRSCHRLTRSDRRDYPLLSCAADGRWQRGTSECATPRWSHDWFGDVSGTSMVGPTVRPSFHCPVAEHRQLLLSQLLALLLLCWLYGDTALAEAACAALTAQPTRCPLMSSLRVRRAVSAGGFSRLRSLYRRCRSRMRRGLSHAALARTPLHKRAALSRCLVIALQRALLLLIHLTLCAPFTHLNHCHITLVVA